jgi:hypothetical protein
MKRHLKSTLAISTALACLVALIGPAQAGTDGYPGPRSARAPGVAAQGTRPNDSARSESSLGHWQGRGVAEWTERLWHWMTSIPLNSNPVFDSSGVNCGLNQEGPVWFLAAPAVPTFTRYCTIPYGKAILMPLAAYFDDYPCPPGANGPFEPAAGQSLEDFLTTDAAGYVDALTLTFASLDGKPLKPRRVTTKVFGFTAAKDLGTGFDACMTGSPQVAVSDGYWLTIDPLPRGDHVVQINVNGPGGPAGGTFNLKVR